MSGSIKLTGAKELDKKLKTLGTKVARKVLRKALRAGAKPIQLQAEINAQSMIGGNLGGLVSNAIATRKQKARVQKGESAMNVLLKKDDEFIHINKNRQKTSLLSKVLGKKSKKRRHYLPSIMEYGAYKERGTRTIAPVFFMTKAWMSQQQVALNTVLRKLNEGVLIEAKKK